MRWLFTEAVLLIFSFVNTNRYTEATPLEDVADFSDDQYEETTTMPPEAENGTAEEKKPDEDADVTFSCDHRIILYILNQSYFLDAMGVSPVIEENEAGECHPPYWATLVTKTNLLLVVVQNGDWELHNDCKKAQNTKPMPTVDSTTSREPCHKLELGRLPRRRLEGCYTYHCGESNITACGMGNLIQIHFSTFIVTNLLILLAYVLLE